MSESESVDSLAEVTKEEVYEALLTVVKANNVLALRMTTLVDKFRGAGPAGALVAMAVEQQYVSGLIEGIGGYQFPDALYARLSVDSDPFFATPESGFEGNELS